MNHSSNYFPGPSFLYSDHRTQTPAAITSSGNLTGHKLLHLLNMWDPLMIPNTFHHITPSCRTTSLLYHFTLLHNQGFRFSRSNLDLNNTSSPIHRKSSTPSRFKVSNRRRKRRKPYSRRTRGSDSGQIRGRSDSRSTRGILTVRKAHFHKQMDSPATNYRNTPKPSPIKLSIGRNRDNDMCFKCKGKGHWANNCLGKSSENSRVLPLPVPVFDGEDGLQYSAPYLICWCGLLCALKSSNSEKNPNRKYYSCLVMDKSHKDRPKTFMWEDMVKEEELLSVPKCRCGAGFCRLYTEASGTNAGLKYFACPIKKGQGACTFKKLLNGEVLTGDEQGDERISPPQSTLGDDGDICLENSTRDGICGHKGKGLEIGSISGQLQRVVPVEMESESEEDTSNEPQRKCNKKLRHDSLEYSSLDSVVEYTNPGSFSRGRARSLNPCDIHIRQVEFSKQISIAGAFPSYDHISIPQIEDRLDLQPPDLRSTQDPPESNVMIASISTGIAKLARELGNKLISILEATDFRKHDYMEQEASITFTALDQLQIWSEPFREQVNELIRSASLLNTAEAFIHNDQSYHDLQEQCKRKKRKRDDFSRDYDAVKSNLEATRERHRTLIEGASCARNMKLLVEADLFSCVVETQYNETRCAQISKQLEESEQELKIALQAAEEASKVLQQKNEKYYVAEAAYKKAKIELRQFGTSDK